MKVSLARSLASIARYYLGARLLKLYVITAEEHCLVDVGTDDDVVQSSEIDGSDDSAAEEICIIILGRSSAFFLPCSFLCIAPRARGRST